MSDVTFDMRDDTFTLTDGDGVADLDIAKLLEFHRAHGKLAMAWTSK
jgi:NDP-sugar pyrophosphorylase family protein